MMWLKVLLGFAFLQLISCQIPSFGGCPDYEPMAEFDRDRFLGTWYETERIFTVTELASKCVSVTYEKRPDGQVWIDNFMTNRFTGIQRKISGTMKLVGKAGEAKYNVKYNSLPINYDTTLDILDTDYDNFAVIYSCSQIGPVGHTQSVWLMARDRLPSNPVMQRAYGVLDKYKITRTFFLKTDQSECEVTAPPIEAYDPTESNGNKVNQTLSNASSDELTLNATAT